MSGQTQEPLSFILVANNDHQLIHSFEKAGWFLADDVTAPSLVTLAKAAILNGSYPHAPMTPYFWNRNVHDLGFEKPTEAQTVRERHHARFWSTPFITDHGQQIYVGIASFDSGIKWGITHRIQPNIDTEREFLFQELSQAGVLSASEKIHFVDPILGQNFAGDDFFTDGDLYVLNFG